MLRRFSFSLMDGSPHCCHAFDFRRCRQAFAAPPFVCARYAMFD